MNFFKIKILLIISISFFSCKEEKSNEEIFLIKLRSIYSPAVENYFKLWSKIEAVYNDCKKENIKCSPEKLIEIKKLKTIQDSIQHHSVILLENLDNDKYGYKEEVLNFINPNPYSSPFTDFELFIDNLAFCSSNEKIVSNINTMTKDTLNINELGNFKLFGNYTIIYSDTYWEGIDLEKYINYHNEPINKIIKADEWYKQANKSNLSNDILNQKLNF